MALEYKQNRGNEMPFDTGYCKNAVPNKGRWPGFHQCKRKPWQDGWCKQHHPDTEAQRAKERDERYQQRYENSTAVQLAKLRENHEVILHQRDELLKVCKLVTHYPIFLGYAQGLRDALTGVITLVEGE